MSRSHLRLRPAQVQDASCLALAERTIAEVPGQLVSQPAELCEQMFAHKIAALRKADNGNYLVAEVGGQIVGHGMLNPMPLAAVRHVVHLTLVVHPGWQGQGIGRAILQALIDWARANAIVEKIELNVRSSNARAQALYRKLGFVEMGRWRRRVKLGSGNYLDDVAMELFVDTKATGAESGLRS